MLDLIQAVRAKPTAHLNPTEYQIPSTERLIKIKTVMAMTALSRSSIYRLIAAGKFPQQRKVYPTGRATVWLLSDIETFVRGEA